MPAGCELRVDYESGASNYWGLRGLTPSESLTWRDARVTPPPHSGVEPNFEWALPVGVPTVAFEADEPLPWGGADGGDARLRSLVPLLLENNPANWPLVATHLPGREGAEVRNRWAALGLAEAAARRYGEIAVDL